MFLHCFPIIPVAMEQCDTKRQSLQNFFSNTKKPQNVRFFTHSKRTGIFPCPFDFSSVLVFFHSQRLNQCRKLGQIPNDKLGPGLAEPDLRFVANILLDLSGQLLVFLLAQPQLGASFHHSHRPDTGLDAFSDIGDGIPHFYYLHRGQTQRLHIGENHIGIGYIEYTLRDHLKCNRLPSVPMAEGTNMHFLPDPKPVYPAA